MLAGRRVETRSSIFKKRERGGGEREEQQHNKLIIIILVEKKGRRWSSGIIRVSMLCGWWVFQKKTKNNK